MEDKKLEDRTTQTPAQICSLLDLCIITAYFSTETWLCHVSFLIPILVSLCMDEVEQKALPSLYRGTLSDCFRYVEDTWGKLKTSEVEVYTTHINMVDNSINYLLFFDCEVHLEADKRLNI